MEDHLKKEILDVYLHGQPIGRPYSDNATLSFAYNPEYPDGQNISEKDRNYPLDSTARSLGWFCPSLLPFPLFGGGLYAKIMSTAAVNSLGKVVPLFSVLFMPS